MANIDVVLSSVDLDVFGGPVSLDVSTDFGKTGTRGSRIYVGAGDPDDNIPESTEVLIDDLYINQNTTDPFYSWLYRFSPAPGGSVWLPLLQLNPSQYSKIQVQNFDEDGDTSFSIPIGLITSDTLTSQQKNRFIIRYSLESVDLLPIASSFTYSIVPEGNNLSISINAAQLSGESWIPLSGAHSVHLFISYIK
jgi:hypothetical protein